MMAQTQTALLGTCPGMVVDEVTVSIPSCASSSIRDLHTSTIAIVPG